MLSRPIVVRNVCALLGMIALALLAVTEVHDRSAQPPEQSTLVRQLLIYRLVLEYQQR